MSDTEIDVPVPPQLVREETNKVQKVRKTKSQPVNKTEKIQKRKNNNWVDHVRSVSKEKGISYKEALKVAKTTYKKA